MDFEKIVVLVKELFGSIILRVSILLLGALYFINPFDINPALSLDSLSKETSALIGILTLACTISLAVEVIVRWIEKRKLNLTSKRMIANESAQRQLSLNYFLTLSDDEITVFANALNKDSRSVHIPKHEPVSSSLVAKGLLQTTNNDPSSHIHAFIIPDFVWSHLHENRVSLLSKFHALQTNLQLQREASIARQHQKHQNTPFARLYNSRRW